MKGYMNTLEARKYTGMGEDTLLHYFRKASFQPSGYGTRRYWSAAIIDDIARRMIKKQRN